MVQVSKTMTPPMITQAKAPVKLETATPQMPSVEQKTVTSSVYNYPQNQVYDMPKQSVLEPKVEEKKVEVKRPVIIPPEEMKPAVDIDGLVEILSSSNYEEQADAMEAVSEVVKFAKDKATELLDNKVFDALLDIMHKDTNALSEKDKNIAERNKEYAMYTTAMLQRLYSDEVKNVAKTSVPATEILGMAGIVNQLKTNSNAKIREAAVASIGYVYKPEYKKELGNLLCEAARDKDSGVRDLAKREIGKALNFEV